MSFEILFWIQQEANAANQAGFRSLYEVETCSKHHIGSAHLDMSKTVYLKTWVDIIEKRVDKRREQAMICDISLVRAELINVTYCASLA